MKLSKLNDEERRFVAQMSAYLMDQQGCYGIFMHRIQVRSVADGGLARRLPPFIIQSIDGDLFLNICFFRLHGLGLAPLAEVLKHEIMHIVLGHMDPDYNTMLRNRFDKGVITVAKELAVNSYMDVDALDKLVGCAYRTSMFGMVDGLSTLHYCKELEASLARGDFTLPEDSCYDWESGGHSKTPVFISLHEEGTDEFKITARRVMMDVYRQATMENKEIGVGWGSVDASEFIRPANVNACVDYRYALRRAVGQRMSVSRVPTKNRKSRRHPQHYGRRHKYQAHVLFAVDTSSSMTKEELSYVNAELKALDSIGAQITVAHTDTKVVKMHPYAGSIEKFHGRGGTSFSDLFKRAEEMAPPPDLIVYFTDGYSFTRMREPATIDTLWVLTGNIPESMFRQSFPWGQIARLRHDRLLD